jgi:hypothetical protein
MILFWFCAIQAPMKSILSKCSPPEAGKAEYTKLQ